MYEIITTKGRKSSHSLTELATWLVAYQPSSTRIVHGEIEAEVEWNDATCENDLRWALRYEEADRLDLTIVNDNIYLVGYGDARSEMIYLRRDVDCVTLVDNTTEVSRPLDDEETIASLLDVMV